jgi:hypothetical protein
MTKKTIARRGARLALVAAAALALAAPATALATAPPAPGSIEIRFDCKRNPVAIIVGGELVFSQNPDPTCPEGFKSGWDIKTNTGG